MKITILNRIGRPVSKYLTANSKRVPAFIVTKDRVYNGLVVEIDDEDMDDFLDVIEAGGFAYHSDDIPEGDFSPKLPK